MTSPQVKRRVVTWCHRYVVNPVTRHLAGRVMPGTALLETTGRRTGLARRTPIGGKRVGDSFWLVSDHGTASAYVRNIEADPRVRLRLRARWHTGTAHPLPADDSRARLRRLPRFNSMMVRALGTDLLTIRIDLDPTAAHQRI
ncbi:nitroreductase/quinone reductase family protein [Nocardia sp. IBHARD005]|uniref:nitroreductase/quinone reductase family protein n=1 Tax=Nocardia sp. IBHARD005 TaxID=3457765 RepID=UPI0040597B7B